MSGHGRRSAEEILAHIEQHGVQRKDQSVNDDRTSVRRNKRSKKHRMTLDLHGLRSAEAAIRLRSALDRCRENGTQELLVIHGYGLHSDPQEGPVLKQLVADLLDNELRPFHRWYRPAPFKDGGDGATLISIR